jgi:predicted  nucleic acid-binding Zn-ribbon protein
LVRNTQDLTKLRENEASLYGEIQGIMAACRNLQSHINKLNQEFQKQQELLYNAEYQIQLMERKVARARGERTLEEKKDLQKDV